MLECQLAPGKVGVEPIVPATGEQVHDLFIQLLADEFHDGEMPQATVLPGSWNSSKISAVRQLGRQSARGSCLPRNGTLRACHGGSASCAQLGYYLGGRVA